MLYQQYALNAPDPALSTRWYIMVPNSSGPTFAVAEQANLTFRKVPAKSRFRSGKNSNYADNSEIDGLSITFYETHDYQVTKWLEEWRLKVFNPVTGVYGVKSQYARDITALMLGIDSNDTKMALRYTECFPTDQAAWQVSYEDATGRIKVEAQFSVDDVEHIYG